MTMEHWDKDEIARKRDELREVVDRASDADLPRIAALHDVLDSLEGLADGTVSESEAEATLAEVHRKNEPTARFSWKSAEAKHMGRGWSIHPADMTEQRLCDIVPMPPSGAALIAAMCEKVWIQTTGDPDVPVEGEDKTAIIVGATPTGHVVYGMTGSHNDPDDGETYLSATALSVPVSVAKGFRDDLNRAIRRAEHLRRVHLDSGRERLERHLVADHAMTLAEAAALAAASIEAAESTIPQVIVGPDGTTVTIAIDEDGHVLVDGVEGGPF